VSFDLTACGKPLTLCAMREHSLSRSPLTDHNFFDLNWLTSEIEYEGFPLLLRKPNHVAIERLKPRFTKLVTIEHFLEKVTKNGLPEKSYNNPWRTLITACAR